MTASIPPQSSSQPASRKGMSPTTKISLLFIPLFLIGVTWVFWQQIQATPARELGVLVSPYGVITVRLTTEPFPPTTGGSVQMTLLMQAAGGSTVALDRVSYKYQLVGGGEVTEAEAQVVGRNAYQGVLRFNQVGDWEVTVQIENDGEINEGTFRLSVRPPI